jgi:hypothetical protein
MTLNPSMRGRLRTRSLRGAKDAPMNLYWKLSERRDALVSSSLRLFIPLLLPTPNLSSSLFLSTALSSDSAERWFLHMRLRIDAPQTLLPS